MSRMNPVPGNETISYASVTVTEHDPGRYLTDDNEWNPYFLANRLPGALDRSQECVTRDHH